MIMNDVKKTVTACGTLLSEDIDEKECELLANVFKLQKLSANEVLLREGEKDDALYIVVDGDITVSRDAGGDERVVLSHLHAGDVAGAMGFIDGNSHSATLTAGKDSHVLMLHRDTLEGMLEEHPQLVYKVMRMIVRSVHQTLLRMDQQFVQMNNYIMREHGRY